MNKEETLKLYTQGKDAWNTWAESLLAERSEMKKAGTWELHRSGWFARALVNFEGYLFNQPADFLNVVFPGDALFRRASFSRLAGFSDATFSGLAGFAGAMFGGNAGFERARFNGDALFRDVQFDGDAPFLDAQFAGDVDFRCARFSRHAKFESMQFSGLAMFAGATFGGDANFRSSQFDRDVDFRCARFSRDAKFESMQFSGLALFTGATFGGDANFRSSHFGREAGFDGASFSGLASFGGASFSGNAWFRKAKFSPEEPSDVQVDNAEFSSEEERREARFDSATFGGEARFDSATFGANASFDSATFDGFASFAKATFQNEANFAAAHSYRVFMLEGAGFKMVPNFIQANFEEAPRLDNVSIPEVRGIWRFMFPFLPGVEASAGTSAEYRALKRLAIQAHDHTQEYDYFASELKALRGNHDTLLPCPLNLLRKDEEGERLPMWLGGPRGTGRYWIGLFYEALSNFGRSIVLPLAWWGLATVGFASCYLNEHFTRAAEVGRGYAVSSGAWLWSWIKSWISDTPAQQLRCLVEQQGNPWHAALDLSLRKALPFPGVGSTEELYLIYTCLYGRYDETLRSMPVIPKLTACLGIWQLLISLVLIFLFLLAVRNHFRIR
jgi:hypothetical protein